MLGKITPKENNMAKGGEVTYLFDVKLFACLRIFSGVGVSGSTSDRNVARCGDGKLWRD